MTGALLVDVDSTIPNLALMHISAWRKSEGLETGFYINDPEEVWASVIFHKNIHKTDGLRWIYPHAKIDIGGTGADMNKNLPPEVDLMFPDYTLYPDWESDLGFTSRGCIRNCSFCIVPKKEGTFRINQHPKEFHHPKHKSAVYMDNNILANRDWFFEVTDWLLSNKIKVDFNQGLDIRLITDEIAERIAELHPLKYWHFAFDSLAYRESVEKGIKILKRAGVNLRNSANFYVYLHNDSDFDSALTRCQILRSYDCLPYIMVNRDSPRTQRMTDLKRWTRPQIFFSIDFQQYKVRCDIMTPSEEMAKILGIVQANPNGITTSGVMTACYGEVPSYRISVVRSKIYAKLEHLEKDGQIIRLIASNQGNVWMAII